jgi:hypothetical protein
VDRLRPKVTCPFARREKFHDAQPFGKNSARQQGKRAVGAPRSMRLTGAFTAECVNTALAVD